MKVKQIASGGILAGVVFSGGWVFYPAGHLLPIPGGKFLAMTPYLAFAMAVALDRIRSPWTITIIAVAMAAVASLFTPLMSVAIVCSGLAADLTGHLLPGSLSSVTRRSLWSASFSFWGFWSFVGVSLYLTQNPIYDVLQPSHLLTMGAFVGVISWMGGRFGVAFSNRIRSTIQSNSEGPQS